MIALLLTLCISAPVPTAQLTSGSDPIAVVKRLYDEKRWEEVVESVPPSSKHPAELDLYRGLALARLQRWEEAKATFEVGREKAPRDKRFLLELAGISYARKDFSAAKRYLKQALHLDPEDVYAQNFLATLYLLQGNLEAALQHWNRIGRPRITDVRFDPEPRVRAVLLDRALAFSPLNVLPLGDLQTARARLENMEIFPRYRFELLPEEDDSFTVVFHSVERNGWGDGPLEGFLSLLRGVPYQTIYPEFYNLRRSALNIVSLLRWDAQKRRAYASVSGPPSQDPRWRFRFFLDGINENWDISRSFQAAASPATDVKLKKASVGAELRSVVSGRLSWRSGVSVAYRKFAHIGSISPQARPLFTDGASLKYRAGLSYQLLQNSEKRISVDTSAAAEFGKVFARPLGSFGKVESVLAIHWFPLARGDDYEMKLQFRAGRVMGKAPFDELYVLGLERDNDLWLRGHIATLHGKKGSAPMGSAYALWNWEADKIVHQNGFLTVKLGPFLDVGKVADSSGDFFARGWLWDPGIQCKVRLLGSLTVILSFGKDLRTGRNAFYTSTSR